MMQYKGGSFKGLKEYKIYYQRWQPYKKFKAVLVTARGLAGHSGRPQKVLTNLETRASARLLKGTIETRF